MKDKLLTSFYVLVTVITLLAVTSNLVNAADGKRKLAEEKGLVIATFDTKQRLIDHIEYMTEARLLREQIEGAK
ncbi:TPA: hypothetical protein PMC50_002835 [Vibrio cholerae]|nr:hypothetical protein [Vibrio cholerae]